ncbi:oxygen-dependent coproporphyrinogen oxidase [Adhaeribacter radiodurans]|uniref:coproporphyrinogen oxidase n=1 Tax=Adhaeribacter radiodurans TaxID=2745197 RepID=A0A7L7L7B2_9BACT|nr:oxygen-dependent coproporphyrinogen oxidase [Adhaeribacter radiodurans]QMU28716.1 oxygen-dependent coproporphyrinogen oxidase [Adhaeribacter radiodurans]
MKKEIEAWFRDFQDRLCKSLEECDGKVTFQEDNWQHESGGGGRSRVIQNGAIFEKGGVNFSAVSGDMPTAAATKLLMPDTRYFATGVSVVLHPENPLIPITHMNVRYLEAGNGEAWFGGGIDLTPIYLDLQQARYFHEQLKTVCDRHHPNYYSRFKQWADDYFYLPHRHETRGIGGIFFDRLTPLEEDLTLEQLFSFVQEVADIFAPTYTTIVNQNRNLAYTEQQKEWQLLRRGRYVEFNLVHDRGTKFGLETGGRVESILMSLPTYASWKYNFKPEPGSAEEQTQQYLKKNVDWLHV